MEEQTDAEMWIEEGRESERADVEAWLLGLGDPRYSGVHGPYCTALARRVNEGEHVGAVERRKQRG